jgi:hypothetical protein
MFTGELMLDTEAEEREFSAGLLFNMSLLAWTLWTGSFFTYMTLVSDFFIDIMLEFFTDYI